MAYDLATVTNSGNQLLASVVTDHSSLVIDKIEVSGTKLASSTDLKSMTSISSVVKTLSANGYQKKDNSFIISTVLDNSSVDADYQAWVFGIWAHKSDGGSPVLMSVITSTNSPDTIVKGAGTPVDYNYKFITTFSNTNSLTIKMSSDTYATNDTVLHNSGDETATGTKTFQKIKISNDKFPTLVQTDGQYITLDGGNSELIPANDSKVVHSTDMRKPASDVAGIEEVNAKQDKIGYTPADDSKVVHDNKNGTITANGTVFNLLNSLSASSIPQDPTKDYNTLPQGLALMSEVDGEPANMPPVKSTYLTLTIASSFTSGRKRQMAWLDAGATSSNNNYTYIRYCVGNTWSSWDSIPTSSQISSLLPSDIARTGQANTFSSLQTFSQGAKTLQTGSYDDANSLVNEGLYYNTNSSIKNGAESLTTGYIQVMSGGGEIVKQIMHSDTDAGLIYDRTSQNGGSSWSNWTQIVTWDQIPSNIVETNQPQTFTAQQTFSIAPIDKTTGNPYITKDGVPAYIKASKNNESSAISDSQASNSGNIYYWTEG